MKVLVRSDELKKRYKHDPVIVSFEYGEGIVYHMISHFYLQRSETRTKKQGKFMSASSYTMYTGLLTLSAHAREGYSSHFVCHSVCLSVCLSLFDFGEDAVFRVETYISTF